MSDASRNAYIESEYNLATALAAVQKRDLELLAIQGSPYKLVIAQSTKGSEFENPPRSRFSVTTNLNTTISFAKGGNVFAQQVPKDQMYYAPINNSTGAVQLIFWVQLVIFSNLFNYLRI